jgi:RHS repeat-associated protein
VVTDFGYTGQRNLDEDPSTGSGQRIGLMDYKARFYSPYLNRFIQPDTIVPGMYKPQSLNRFSYVGNNRIRYRDPSGHCRIGDDADDCFRPGVNNPPSLADYGVTVNSNPNMTYKEKRAILEAVVDVGDAFAAERGLGESGAEAFSAVYDPITINRVDSFEHTDKDGNVHTINSGCETVGNVITCASFGDKEWQRLQSVINNIVHELGHVFDPVTDVHGTGSSGLPDPFVRYASSILHNNDFVQWRVNTSGGHNEEFANFFVAWVYGTWGPDADTPYAGVDSTPRNWMTTNMSQWLTP